MTKKLNHIAVVVENIEDSLAFWRDALGLEVSRMEDVEAEAARVAFLPLGESKLELVQPLGEESGLTRYLQKRGPGLHHICIEVMDIQTALNRLQEHQVELINQIPRTREDGTLYAFIHPKSTAGVLLELYQLP
jgi:methylmalonyl-CoA/ethylmalonyl-CoA epimerase